MTYRIPRQCAALVRRLALAFMLILAACGGSVELLTDITEAEANDVVGVLVDAGIDARKAPGKEGMVSVNIDQAQISKALTLLHAEGLPRERFAKMGDVFRKEGLISSPLEERARYLWALSQELSSTISQIDGVLKARVHVVLPERSTGSDPAMPSSAAVFIKYRRQLALEEIVPQIKRLVSNSIPGLGAEKVSVVMVPAAPVRRAAESVNASGMSATVWGYDVSATSATPIRGLLTGMLVLLCCAIGAIGFLALKLRGSSVSWRLPSLFSRKGQHTSGET